jgi:hypothetical protein
MKGREDTRQKRGILRFSHTESCAENPLIIYDDDQAILEIENQKAHAKRSGFAVYFRRSKDL